MTRRFNDDVPASVFWVRESLPYPCRAELYVVGRHSGAATPYTNNRVVNKLPIISKLIPVSL